MTATSDILPGQTLENPVTGERLTFTHTAGSTGGGLTGKTGRRVAAAGGVGTGP